MSGPAKLNNPAISTRQPDVSDIFYFANPTTGLGGKNTIAALIAMISSTASAPVKSYTDIAAMLANTTIPIGYFAFVIDDGSGWALYFFLGPDRSEIADYHLLITEGGGGIEHFKGAYPDDTALTTAHPTAVSGDYAYVDAGVGNPVELWIWDDDDSEWIQSGTGGLGTVESVTGDGVDNTDPDNPVIGLPNGLPVVDTTGTAISFAIPQIYGSVATPETGNITIVTTGLVKGMTQLLIHNNGTEPTYGAEIQIINGAYVTGVDNYILLLAVSTTLILATISQELV